MAYRSVVVGGGAGWCWLPLRLIAAERLAVAVIYRDCKQAVNLKVSSRCALLRCPGLKKITAPSGRQRCLRFCGCRHSPVAVAAKGYLVALVHKCGILLADHYRLTFAVTL